MQQNSQWEPAGRRKSQSGSSGREATGSSVFWGLHFGQLTGYFNFTIYCGTFPAGLSSWPTETTVEITFLSRLCRSPKVGYLIVKILGKYDAAHIWLLIPNADAILNQ